MITIDNLYMIREKYNLSFAYKIDGKMYTENGFNQVDFGPKLTVSTLCSGSPDSRSSLRSAVVHIPKFELDPEGSYPLAIEFKNNSVMLYQIDRNNNVVELTKRPTKFSEIGYPCQLSVPDVIPSDTKLCIKEMEFRPWGDCEPLLMQEFTDFDSLYTYIEQMIKLDKEEIVTIKGSFNLIYEIDGVNYPVMGTEEANALRNKIEKVITLDLSLVKRSDQSDDCDINPYYLIRLNDGTATKLGLSERSVGSKYVVKDSVYNRVTKTFVEAET